MSSRRFMAFVDAQHIILCRSVLIHASTWACRARRLARSTCCWQSLAHMKHIMMTNIMCPTHHHPSLYQAHTEPESISHRALTHTEPKKDSHEIGLRLTQSRLTLSTGPKEDSHRVGSHRALAHTEPKTGSHRAQQISYTQLPHTEHRLKP